MITVNTLEEARAIRERVLRRAAEQQAWAMRQRAIQQAAVIRRAAWEAEQLQSQILAMSSDLNRLATSVTQYLGEDAMSAPPAETWHSAGAAAGGQTLVTPVGVVIRPRSPAVVSPPLTPLPERPRRAEPGTKPPAKPAAKPGRRQAAAFRKMVIVFVAVVGVTLAGGATEIGLHGFPFFVFRSAGTGATDNNGLQENQGPGQPDAPRAHHSSPPKPLTNNSSHKPSEAHRHS